MKVQVSGELSRIESDDVWSYSGDTVLIAYMTDALMHIGMDATNTVDVTEIVKDEEANAERHIGKVDDQGNFLKETKTYKVTKFMIEFDQD
jgi:hypothetical protein